MRKEKSYIPKLNSQDVTVGYYVTYDGFNINHRN